MPDLRTYRYQAGRFILRRELRYISRSRKTTCIDEARSIGILYILGSEPAYNEISDIVARLQNENKSVKALGFIDGKLNKQRFLPKISFDFLTLKNLDFFGIPRYHYVDDFVEQDFDLLINLCETMPFPVEYILAKSNAKLKTGIGGPFANDHLDITVSKDQSLNISAYFNMLYHYLTIIRK